MDNIQRAIYSDYGTLSLPPIPPKNLGGRPRSDKPIVRRKQYVIKGRLVNYIYISYKGKKYTSTAIRVGTLEAWLEKKLKEITKNEKLK